MLLTRITRALATAMSIGVVAAMATAAAASAAPIDPVLLSAGNVSFGNAFANSDPTLAGDFDWNLAANGTTTGRLMNGNIYIENSLDAARMVIEYYDDAVNHNLIATREGGKKVGTGVFVNTFPITVGGVNGDITHAHVLLQKKVNNAGPWITVDIEFVDL
jgi:hypothetical protein